MQNYFNDSKQVLDHTKRILINEILSNQTSLIEHKHFSLMTNYTPYEAAENLFIASDSRDCELDREEFQDPLEWWLVSKWLHDQLNILNYVTLETDWGFYWGRTSSGQAIEMDGVVQEVARNICT